MKRLATRFCVLAAGVLAISLVHETAAPSVASAAASPVVASQTLTFNVYLPLQNEAALQTLLADQQTTSSPTYHKWLTPAQFNTRFGPSATTVAASVASLKAQGLTVLAVNGRTIRVTGTAAQVNRAFATSLAINTESGVSRAVSTSALVLPAALKSQGAMIPAFSPVIRMHRHSKLSAQVSATTPADRLGPAGGYYFDDLKEAYGYPSYQAYDGTGANVAVLMSSDAYDSDIAAVFNAQPLGFISHRTGKPIQENFTGITGKPAPTITHQPVDQPNPTLTDALDEASLDVQEVLGGAPGSNVTLVDIPDLSDPSILDGYYYIVTNNDTKTGKPFELVNSSFGGCELTYLPAYNAGVDYTFILDIYTSIFEQGNAEGITFVASSGDSAGLGCPDTNYVDPLFGIQPTAPPRFVPGVEFPASSPLVTAVGGGNLITSYTPGSLVSTYVSENAQGDPEIPYDAYGFGVNVTGGYWGAGGGVSSLFAKPSYQNLVNTGTSTGRAVPDIGMQVGGCPGGISFSPCGPNRSYVIVAIQAGIGGGFYGLIGTSVSSPELVGAMALFVQKSGSALGNVNPYLYAKAAAQTAGSGVFYNRYIPGFDGRYTNSFPAGGYTYLVGNGTPQVANLFDLGPTRAGTPQTASNP